MKTLINKMVNFFSGLAENRAKKKYIKAGNNFGYAVSLIYNGECGGFKKMLVAWERWEKKIVKYGYRPLGLDTFIDSGGYGYKLPAFEKLKKDEKPIFHAKFYRDKFLGKIKPVLDQERLMAGESVVARYLLPSTNSAN